MEIKSVDFDTFVLKMRETNQPTEAIIDRIQLGLVIGTLKVLEDLKVLSDKLKFTDEEHQALGEGVQSVFIGVVTRLEETGYCNGTVSMGDDVRQELINRILQYAKEQVKIEVEKYLSRN